MVTIPGSCRRWLRILEVLNHILTYDILVQEVPSGPAEAVQQLVALPLVDLVAPEQGALV